MPDLYIPAAKIWVEMKRVKGDTVIIGKGWENARDQVVAVIDART